MSPNNEPMNADDLQLPVTYTMPYGKYQGRPSSNGWSGTDCQWLFA